MPDSPSTHMRRGPRSSKMTASVPAPNGAPSSSAFSSQPPARTSPYLPTPTERLLVAAYPVLLAFGALFGVLSPETRASPYDAALGSHSQDPGLAPSYFARKDNLVNLFFVKRGWVWISLAFAAFAVTHPHFAGGASPSSSASSVEGVRWRRTARLVVRWAVVTLWWVLVTQWCFGPALIDRGFRWTGGRCEAAQAKVAAEGSDLIEDEGVAATAVEVFTAGACKTAGGRWRGGHDISGHVFMLVLGSAFLLQEVGWVVLRHAAGGFFREERCVVMPDGAVKRASVEAERADGEEHGRQGRDDGFSGNDVRITDALGTGGKFAAAVVVLCWWMMLMTAIYFHTWFEKLTGLLVALAGLYVVYILPRWVPALRNIIGLPGI